MVRAKQLTDGAGEATQALSPLDVQRLQVEGFINLTRELAINPNVDPDKLEKLLNLQERVLDRGAKQAYDDAMHLAQEEMEFIRTDKKNTDKGNKYASYKALDKAIRPIYTRHGFSISFDTGPGKPEYGPIPDGYIRVLMDIAHSSGHQVQKHVEIPVETTGAQGTKMMTRIHATGSAMSYGKRYLLIFGFNLAVGEQDDDGNAAGRGGGGQDHRYKTPQSKSEQKGGASAAESPDPTTSQKAFPNIKRADNDADVIQKSSLATIRSNLKRFKIPEDDFSTAFGFPLEQLSKSSLNEMLDWMKERGQG